MLARFRIPPELISEAKIFRVSDTEARSYGFEYWTSSNLAGLVLPYYDRVSQNRVTSRLRRDKHDLDKKGREKNKYIFARGDNSHLYFPPGVGELLGDSEVRAAFVEAEKSALALLAWAKRTRSKLLPIATGGCWGWRGKIGAEDENQDKERRGALPDFSRIEWTDRKAYIIFDSNVTTNPKVRSAREALAKELAERGAKVYLVTLPLE